MKECQKGITLYTVGIMITWLFGCTLAPHNCVPVFLYSAGLFVYFLSCSPHSHLFILWTVFLLLLENNEQIEIMSSFRSFCLNLVSFFGRNYFFYLISIAFVLLSPTKGVNILCITCGIIGDVILCLLKHGNVRPTRHPRHPT